MKSQLRRDLSNKVWTIKVWIRRQSSQLPVISVASHPSCQSSQLPVIQTVEKDRVVQGEDWQFDAEKLMDRLIGGLG